MNVSTGSTCSPRKWKAEQFQKFAGAKKWPSCHLRGFYQVFFVKTLDSGVLHLERPFKKKISCIRGIQKFWSIWISPYRIYEDAERKIFGKALIPFFEKELWWIEKVECLLSSGGSWMELYIAIDEIIHELSLIAGKGRPSERVFGIFSARSPLLGL